MAKVHLGLRTLITYRFLELVGDSQSEGVTKHEIDLNAFLNMIEKLVQKKQF
uniref:Uncharacterized protein n=1 Tax=Anguilla anguilla TaxID=7936 RepID=A0A0E9QLH3_ANGAN